MEVVAEEYHQIQIVVWLVPTECHSPMSEETKRIEAPGHTRHFGTFSVTLGAQFSLCCGSVTNSGVGVVLISKSEQQHIPFEASR